MLFLLWGGSVLMLLCVSKPEILITLYWLVLQQFIKALILAHSIQPWIDIQPRCCRY
jgi:hypothetical protein